jgi:ribose 5-phosphate isomerase B
MKVIIGSDHGGYDLKVAIKEFLSSKDIEIIDVGIESLVSCDYPEVAKKLAREVLKTGEKGILVCGTGIGMSIAANKYDGIRAALCSDTYSARMTREHNDSNVLCLGERVLGKGLAQDIVWTWLNTEFSQGERHKNRIALIEKIEKERI